MKTSKIKTVRNIGRIRTLLVTLSVAVCLATLMGCGNKPEDDTSPAADTSPVADPIETLRKAAEQGNADAQYDFGVLYANGKGGVPKDHAEALKWFRKAAEQGHAQAQFDLVVPYAFGFGVPKDYAEAFKWFRKAAERGRMDAQNNLGDMYAEGRGVPQDYVAAYAWSSVAAASGDESGRKHRDEIKGDLTPSQLEKGQVMAREIYERITKRNAAETHYE